MQDQAIGYENSNVPPSRWSAWAYALTGFSLLGTIVAILLIATGRTLAAEFAACLSLSVVLSYGLVDGLDRRNAGDKGRSDEDARGASLGWLVALLFLGTCYYVKILPLPHEAPVVIPQSVFDATFLIVLSIIGSIPQAYRVWRTSPPAIGN